MRLKPIALLASAVLFFPSSAIAQTVQICRPQTRNVLQQITQKMAFTAFPVCEQKGGIELRLNHAESFHPNRGLTFQDKKGRRYRTHPTTVVFPADSNNRR